MAAPGAGTIHSTPRKTVPALLVARVVKVEPAPVSVMKTSEVEPPAMAKIWPLAPRVMLRSPEAVEGRPALRV